MRATSATMSRAESAQVAYRTPGSRSASGPGVVSINRSALRASA